MKLHEYQSKQIFAKYGIPIPKGRVAATATEARQIAEELGGRVVVKSQVLAGAVMAVSAVHGRASLPEGGDPKEVAMKSKAQFYGKPGVYRIFNQVPNRFKAKHGKTLCRELTVPWQQSWLCKEHALFCRDIITDAAGIAADLILTDKDELANKPFGENVESLKD